MSELDREPHTALRVIAAAVGAIRAVSRWGAYVAAGLTFLLMIVTVSDVLMRYGANRPITGAFEFSEYLFIGAVLLGLAHVEIERSHVSVHFAVGLLGPRQQRVVRLVNLSIALVLSGIMTWYALDSAITSFVRAETRQGYTVAIPMWPARAALPVGFAMLCLAFLANLAVELLPRAPETLRRKR